MKAIILGFLGMVLLAVIGLIVSLCMTLDHVDLDIKALMDNTSAASQTPIKLDAMIAAQIAPQPELKYVTKAAQAVPAEGNSEAKSTQAQPAASKPDAKENAKADIKPDAKAEAKEDASPDGLPPILRGVSGPKGAITACPPTSEAEAQKRAKEQLPEALSPELNQRLTKDFPIGSDEAALIHALQKQQFVLGDYCKMDETIRVATFYHQGSGLFSSDVSARIYWKTGTDKKLVWTKGYVSFDSL